MKLSQFVKVGVVSLGLLALAACSTSNKENLGAGNAGMEGASASGYGNGGEFNGVYLGNLRAVGGQNQSFYFAFDSSQVYPQYSQALQVHASYLQSHPGMRVRLEGNTDSRGSPEYNIGLGWRRANAIAQALQMDGVAKRQIKEISYGEERPVAMGHTEAAYRLNRRVDLVYEK